MPTRWDRDRCCGDIGTACGEIEVVDRGEHDRHGGRGECEIEGAGGCGENGRYEIEGGGYEIERVDGCGEQGGYEIECAGWLGKHGGCEIEGCGCGGRGVNGFVCLFCFCLIRTSSFPCAYWHLFP